LGQWSAITKLGALVPDSSLPQLTWWEDGLSLYSSCAVTTSRKWVWLEGTCPQLFHVQFTFCHLMALLQGPGRHFTVYTNLGVFKPRSDSLCPLGPSGASLYVIICTDDQLGRHAPVGLLPFCFTLPRPHSCALWSLSALSSHLRLGVWREPRLWRVLSNVK
jgi:hypothetical protein